MKKVLFLLTAIIMSHTTISAQSENQLKDIKLSAHFSGNSAAVKVYINNVLIGFDEDGPSRINLYNENNPLRKADLPDAIKETMFFIIKKGINKIKVEYNNTQAESNYEFQFDIQSGAYPLPIFLISDSYENSPRNKGVVEKEFVLDNTIPADFKTVLGYEEQGFIYAHAAKGSIGVTLNGKMQGSLGGLTGIIQLSALKKGKNSLVVSCSAKNDFELKYTIVTPGYTKEVVKQLKPDSEAEDTFSFDN